MSTDKKGTKILAHTFFANLRTGGYTPNQILDIATELIDLVTTDLRELKPAEAGGGAGNGAGNGATTPEKRASA